MKLEQWQKQNSFMPLTYLEAVVDKPLIVKLTEGWKFVTYPMKAVNFAAFIEIKDRAYQEFEYWIKKRPRKEEKKLAKTQGVLSAVAHISQMLYEISKQEYADKQEEYRKFLINYFYENIDVMLDVFQKFLEYNTRIEKKNTIPSDLESDTKRRSMDKWRGFLCGREQRKIFSTSFLVLLHEDEENITRTIGAWRDGKERQRKEKAMRRFENVP